VRAVSPQPDPFCACAQPDCSAVVGPRCLPCARL